MNRIRTSPISCLKKKIRAVIARNPGVSLNNDYGLLERIGGACAGAVSLYPEAGIPKREPDTYRQLSLDELNSMKEKREHHWRHVLIWSVMSAADQGKMYCHCLIG